MQLTLQPCITAGVALAAAGLIAVTPSAPAQLAIIHMPDIQLAASGTAVDITPDPLESWSEVLKTAATNIDGLKEYAATTPTLGAILHDVAENQLAYAQTLAGGASTSWTNLTDGLHGLPEIFHTAFQEAWSGDIVQAYATVWNYLSIDLDLDIYHPYIDGLTTVLDNIANNAYELGTRLPGALNDILVSPLYGFGSA